MDARRATALAAAILASLVPLASQAVAQPAAPKAGWIPVKSVAMEHIFGEFPKPVRQKTYGRVRLTDIARVSSVVIHGKKHTGDLLVIKGQYHNLGDQATYWTEGYAFIFGTQPKLCQIEICGPMPKGDWSTMGHGFGTPIVDYPKKKVVAAHSTIAFREAIPLPPASQGPIRTLRDIWVLPIYAAFDYYEFPFPRSQLVRLSEYFGKTAIPRA